MTQKAIDFEQGQLSYRDGGSGPAVVLLHGFGEDGTIWAQQVQALRHCRLLVPDLPGSGASDALADSDMDHLAAAVHALLEAEGIGRCVLIGHSMGGYVALAFAARWPERLAGLGFFHSTAFADTEEKKATRRKGIAFIEEHGAAEFLRATLPNLYAPATRAEKKELIDRQQNSIHNFSGAALVSYYRSMIKRPDRTDLLRTLRLPVLFVLGRHDAAVPLADGLAQSHLPALSYIHVLEESGHMGMVEEAEASNVLLQAYISDTFNLISRNR